MKIHRRILTNILQNEQKEGEEREQHLELIPVIVSELKPVSKINDVGKTENGDLPKKPNTNSVVCSRHPKQMLRTKRKEKDRFHENVERGVAEKLNAVLVNSGWPLIQNCMQNLQ